MSLAAANSVDRLAEPQPDLLQDRRRRDREAEVVGQEVDHLAGHLQVGHPPVEVDPVEALQIQTDVPIEDVVHGHHAGRHRVPPGSGVSATPPACPHPTATSPANPTTTSAVRGEASLDMSPTVRDTPRPFQPAIAQRDIELEVAQCVGGVFTPP